ncbi:hypothetical protein P9112_002407 [Eukaryota sp. TZLM1-RC]
MDSPLATPRSRISVDSISSPSDRSIRIPKELHSLLTTFVDDFTSLEESPDDILAYTSSYFYQKFLTSILKSGVSHEFRLDILAEILQHLTRTFSSQQTTVIDKQKVIDLAEVCGLQRSTVVHILKLCRTCSAICVDYEEFILCCLLVKNNNFDAILLNIFSVFTPNKNKFPKATILRLLKLLYPLLSVSSQARAETLINGVTRSEVLSFGHPDLLVLLKC